MPDPVDTTGGRQHGVTAGMNVNLPGVDTAAKQIADLSKQVTGLNKALSDLSSKSASLGSNISGMLSKISASTGGGPGGGGGGGGGGGSYANGGVRSAGTSFVGSMFGKVNENGWLRDLMMFPTRFMADQVSASRDLALGSSGALGMQSFATGTNTANMMTALAGNFGNVLGNPQDLLAAASIGGRVGAGIDWRGYSTPGQTSANPYTQNMPRTAGFYRGVMEAQRMNPAAPVSELAGTIGGYTANVGAQQAGTFMTGGAFSMIKQGNQQKSISEWAEGILKFLQNQRPGGARGKPFTYGELMTQNFPGSNIDVWLSVNGVPDGMKDYFWTYAMARTNAGTEDIFGANYAPTQTNVSYQRLQAGNAQTRAGFQLAGKLSGQYANKEQANRWFNELLGSMLGQILPQALSSATLSYVQYLPDAIQEMLMQLSERTTVGALGGAMMGWGSLLPGLSGGTAGNDIMGGANSLLAKMGIVPGGDVGDVGDYGPMGATTTAGLHPDMRKRVDAMMMANPRLKVTSGLRDHAKQQTLKRKGVGRVSGKPSAHTRGMAADMGPPSQFGWLVQNAGKFGLKSGVGAGEPWHVGLGDPEHVGDISDVIQSIMGIFGNFGSLFTSNEPSQQISGVAGGTTQILKMLLSMFGGQPVNEAQLEPRNVYQQLVGATQGALKQGLVFPTITPGRGVGQAMDGISGGPGGGASSWDVFGGGGVAGSKSLESFFTQVLREMGAPVTRNNLQKLGGIAKTEGNNSGTFNPFNYVGGSQFPKFNSIGVRNYPDFETGVDYTVKLLQQGNTARWRNNLLSDASYADWWDATNAFYTWGKPAQISAGAADAFLSNPVHGAGDIDYASYMPSASTPVNNGPTFHNTFVIQSSGNGGNNGGIDVRRVGSQLADQLETQMRQRLARSN